MAASASSESQGKTIALVIFVLLTIVAAVTAYYFYDQVDQLTQAKNAADQAVQTAKRDETTAKNNYKELRGLVYGEQAEEDHAKVIELVKNDLKTPKLGDTHKERKPEYKSFKDSIDFLHDELGASDTRIAEQNAQIAKLQKEVEALQEQYQQQVDEITKDRDAKAAELQAETTKFKDTIAQRDQEIRDISDERLRALNAKQDAEQELERKMQQAGLEIQELKAIADAKGEQERLRDQIEFEHEDGKIVELTRAEGNLVAYINLGADDGLSKNTTFSIYGRDPGGNPYKMPKANMVVTKILGPHRAMTRVDNTKITDPVIPGDLLYNPLWSPGNKISIGLVGLIYMDDKESEDSLFNLKGHNRDFIREIERLGAKVDALYDLDQQKIKGDISVNTRWLLIGEIPEVKDSDTQDRKDFLNNLKKAEQELRREASVNGVPVINVRNFLTFMGKQQPQTTVHAGQERLFMYGKDRPKLVDKGPVPATQSAEDKDKNGK